MDIISLEKGRDKCELEGVKAGSSKYTILQWLFKEKTVSVQHFR